MKQIKKKDLKEVIRLSKNWYDLGCDGGDELYNELYKARMKAFGSLYTSLSKIVFIVFYINNYQKKTTLKTYYKVFEALGFELV